MMDPEKRFIEYARQQGEATREGDPDGANAAYQGLVAALRELRKLSDRGEHFLLTLLFDKDLSVVTWAALYLLPIREVEAIDALRRVVETRTPRISFDAEMTLEEWIKGRLTVE